jgi:hypothetical protein
MTFIYKQVDIFDSLALELEREIKAGWIARNEEGEER